MRDGQGNYSVDVLLRVVGGEEEEDKGEGEGMGGGEKESEFVFMFSSGCWIGGRGAVRYEGGANGGVELEARLLELYRERNLQGGDPPGSYNSPTAFFVQGMPR